VVVGLHKTHRWREAALRALVLFGALAALITESLGAFGLVHRGSLCAAWGLAILAAVVHRRRAAVRGPVPCRRPMGVIDWLLSACIATMVLIVGFIALRSPPNSADAMAYHMPRVVYWAQQRSVDFFPTPYFNQITLPPFAEYVMMHGYVLAGGDRFANLGQFLAMLGSILGVSLIARSLSAGPRGQTLAALFCATLPNGILQASGAKNDYLAALWLVAMVYFALEGRPAFTGLALGLALLTKATAYLFAPFLLAAVLVLRRRHGDLRPRAFAIACLAGVAVLNGPHYARNFRLSGSILGYDSAQGDGRFRWRNERLDWKAGVSNLLRHTSEQMGAWSPEWNRAVYDACVRLHRWAGIDPNDLAGDALRAPAKCQS